MTTVDAGAVFVIALHVPPALLDSTKLEGVSAYRTGHSAGWKDAESVLAIITDSLVDKIQAWYGQNMSRILSGNCRKRHHNTGPEQAKRAQKTVAADGCDNWGERTGVQS